MSIIANLSDSVRAFIRRIVGLVLAPDVPGAGTATSHRPVVDTPVYVTFDQQCCRAPRYTGNGPGREDEPVFKYCDNCCRWTRFYRVEPDTKDGQR